MKTDTKIKDLKLKKKKLDKEYEKAVKQYYKLIEILDQLDDERTDAEVEISRLEYLKSIGEK